MYPWYQKAKNRQLVRLTRPLRRKRVTLIVSLTLRLKSAFKFARRPSPPSEPHRPTDRFPAPSDASARPSDARRLTHRWGAAAAGAVGADSRDRGKGGGVGKEGGRRRGGGRRNTGGEVPQEPDRHRGAGGCEGGEILQQGFAFDGGVGVSPPSTVRWTPLRPRGRSESRSIGRRLEELRQQRRRGKTRRAAAAVLRKGDSD